MVDAGGVVELVVDCATRVVVGPELDRADGLPLQAAITSPKAPQSATTPNVRAARAEPLPTPMSVISPPGEP